jgi:hypothetical protein
VHGVHGLHAAKADPLAASAVDVANDPVRAVPAAERHQLHALGRHHPPRHEAREHPGQ